MAIAVAALIDQAKLVSNNRRNLAIADTDWVTFINWAVESWWKFRTALDPYLYFQQLDFTLVGGAAGSQFNLDLAFTVTLASVAALPTCTAAGSGPGKTLTENGNGTLVIDGVAPIVLSRVLIKNEAASQNNGIYIVSNTGSAGSSFVLTRASDFDQAGLNEVQVGAIVTPTGGVTLANDPCILTAFGGTVDSATQGLQTWIVNDVYTRFRSLHGLDLYPDTGQRLTIRGRNFQQRNDGVGFWVPSQYCPQRRYDIRSNILTVTPYEASSGPYRVYYRGAAYKWATPTDTDPLDAVLEPDIEAIVLLAACSALNIEETSNDPYIKRINTLKAEVTNSYERDDTQAAQLADVEDLSGGGWGYP
jgi:hypothetical protein